MIAYKPFSLAPLNQRPSGIPGEYPWQETPCTESNQEALIADGWLIVGDADYAALKASMAVQVATAATAPTLESDERKYLLRSLSKDKIIAGFAGENMARLRAGQWTTPQLIMLTQHPQSIAVLNDVQSLSFELAVQKIAAHPDPLMTPEVKASMIDKLTANFF
jgi:hypothetical protein